MILPPTDAAGRVIITWPQPTSGVLFPPLVMLHDADSGEQITSVVAFAVQSDAREHQTKAVLLMLTAADGSPLLDAGEAQLDDDGEPITGAFTWLVAEMRVAEAAA